MLQPVTPRSAGSNAPSCRKLQCSNQLAIVSYSSMQVPILPFADFSSTATNVASFLSSSARVKLHRLESPSPETDGHSFVSDSAGTNLHRVVSCNPGSNVPSYPVKPLSCKCSTVSYPRVQDPRLRRVLTRRGAANAPSSRMLQCTNELCIMSCHAFQQSILHCFLCRSQEGCCIVCALSEIPRKSILSVALADHKKELIGF